VVSRLLEVADDTIVFNDDGDLCAVRQGRMKFHFAVQDSKGFMVWFDPFKKLRAPYMFDLRADPFERAKEGGMDYGLQPLGNGTRLLDRARAGRRERLRRNAEGLSTSSQERQFRH
jgi:hypothetical protein